MHSDTDSKFPSLCKPLNRAIYKNIEIWHFDKRDRLFGKSSYASSKYKTCSVSCLHHICDSRPVLHFLHPVRTPISIQEQISEAEQSGAASTPVEYKQTHARTVIAVSICSFNLRGTQLTVGGWRLHAPRDLDAPGDPAEIVKVVDLVDLVIRRFRGFGRDLTEWMRLVRHRGEKTEQTDGWIDTEN